MKNIHQINDNIYITNDEVIKAGDYFWKPDCNMIFKAEYTPHKGCQKIILTTDQELIKDGVQAIDDEFLQWFVKNPSCESVEVDKNWNYPLDKSWEYKLRIIPKDEAKERAKNYMSLKGALETKQIKCYCGHTTMCDCSPLDEAKQETTIEEAKLRQLFKNRSNCYADADDVVQTMDEDCFISTINEWQQGRIYSEEEVKKLIVDFLFTRGIGKEVENVNEWFNQVKKK
jgi:hypothetical protein